MSVFATSPVTKVTARSTKAELVAHIAELDARWAKASAEYMEARRVVGELRAQPVAPIATVGGRRPGDVVGSYTRADGSRWVKVVVSDKVIAHRPAH